MRLKVAMNAMRVSAWGYEADGSGGDRGGGAAGDRGGGAAGDGGVSWWR